MLVYFPVAISSGDFKGVCPYCLHDHVRVNREADKTTEFRCFLCDKFFVVLDNIEMSDIKYYIWQAGSVKRTRPRL